MKSKKQKAFTEALERILSVTHEEIKRREAADKEQRKFTTKKRGRKAKSSASLGRV